MRCHEELVDKEVRRMLTNAKSYRHSKSPGKRTSPTKKGSPSKASSPTSSPKKRSPTKSSPAAKNKKTKSGTKAAAASKASKGHSKGKNKETNLSEQTAKGSEDLNAYSKGINARHLTNTRVRNLIKTFQGNLKNALFTPGERVIVLHEGQQIAEALFLEQKDGMFSELSFKLHNGGDHSEGLSLYQVVNENESTGRGRKVEFHELEEDDFFLWKTEKLKKKKNLRSDEERRPVERL